MLFLPKHSTLSRFFSYTKREVGISDKWTESSPKLDTVHSEVVSRAAALPMPFDFPIRPGPFQPASDGCGRSSRPKEPPPPATAVRIRSRRAPFQTLCIRAECRGLFGVLFT